MEPVSVVLDVRDRVSTATACLTALFENSPPLAKVILVAGDVLPAHLRASLREDFGDRVLFDLYDRPVSQAESRLIGLRQVETALAVTMDLDVVVRPGWLEPLVDRLRSTGAALVTPLILEDDHRIHTAANFLYVNERDGKRWSHKVLDHHGMPFHGSSPTLRAAVVDYAEYHCTLVDVATILSVDAFDPTVAHELHTGMVLAAAGHEQWAEPSSVVMFPLRLPLCYDDLAAYRRYWDPKRYLDVFGAFEERWGIDPTEEGRFRAFLGQQNDEIPFWSRILPGAAGFTTAVWLRAASRLPSRVLDLARRKLRELRRRLVASRWP